MLSKAAWNVLLKTVEEPPEHVKFIFATTEVHQVLPTIISRCQRFDLLPIPTKLISERLKLIAQTEKVNLDDNAINAIARAAEGGMRDAQSLLDQMIAYFSIDGQQITEQQVLSLFGLTNSSDLELLLESMINNAPADVVTVVSTLAKRGKNLETLFDDLLAMLRAVHLCSIMPNVDELLDESEETIARWKNIAATTDSDTLQILLEIISPVGRVLHDALNKQVFLETILLKAMREAHAVRIGDILNRLNQLRGAGELKFLDTLPAAARENIAVSPTASGSVKDRMSAPEESRHTRVQETPKTVEPIVNSAPAAEPVPTPAAEPVAEPIPAPAPIPAPVAEPVAEPTPEPVAEPVKVVPAAEESVELERTFDEPDPEEVLATQIKAAPKARVAEEPETVMIVDDDADMVPVLEDSAAKQLANTNVMEKLAEENSSKSLAPETKKQRRSIINDSVDVKREIANDPEVIEILDLFGGDVIDVHR